MRKVLAIAATQIRMTMKSKPVLAMMFLLPLMLTMIFGVMIGGGTQEADQKPTTPRGRIYPLVLIDEDQSVAARLLIESLQAERSLQIRQGSRADFERLLADKKVVAGLVIPAGYQAALTDARPSELELISQPGSNLELGLRPTLWLRSGQLARDFHLALQLAGAGANEESIRTALTRIERERARSGSEVTQQWATPPAKAGRPYGALEFSAMGFTVMSVTMSVFMLSGAILFERQRGTWGRMLTTPTSRSTLLGGFVLSFYLTGILQFSLLVVLTRLLFGFGWGPLLPLFAVASALVLAAVGLGLFLAGLTRTYEQLQTVGTIVVIATSMLGGLFWPLEILSPTMQQIGFLTPQAWAMEGLREVILRSADWANLAWPLAVLMAIALIFTGAGLLRVKFE